MINKSLFIIEIRGKTRFLTRDNERIDPIDRRIDDYSFRDFEREHRCSRDEFSLFDQGNLTFNHSVDTESSLEEISSERFKDGGVLVHQFDEYIREYLTKWKNTSFYRQIGRNCPIALINGSDETVHHEPLPFSRGHPIAIGHMRGGHVLMRYKTHETRFVRSSSSI